MLLRSRKEWVGIAVLVACGSDGKPDGDPALPTGTTGPPGTTESTDPTPGCPSLLATYIPDDGPVSDVVVAGELAYLAVDGWGVEVVDVSNPAAPSLVGGLPMVYRAVNLELEGELLYVTTVDRGVSIVDVSNPSFPRTIGSFDPADETFGMDVEGDLLAVGAMGAGLVLADVSDPTAPQVLGTLPPGTGWTRDVSLRGDLAYVAQGGEGLWVVDIADPSAPVTVGSVLRPGWSYGIARQDDHVWLLDAAFGVRILDVSNPTAPEPVTEIFEHGGAVEVLFAGDRAFLGTYAQGLQLVDAADGAAPVVVDAYVQSGTLGLAVAGTVGYLAGDWSGLHLVDLCDDSGVAVAPTIGSPGPRVPACGDAWVDPGEACDDSDRTNGDGCSASCQFEPGWSCDTSGQPTQCTAAKWWTTAQINAISAVASQTVDEDFMSASIRLGSVDLAALYTQGLGPALLSESAYAPAYCGAPGDACDVTLPLGGVFGSTGHVGVLVDDPAEGLLAPSVTLALDHAEIAGLNARYDYFGDGEMPVAWTQDGVRALSVALGQTRGEVWGPDELLCRGFVVVGHSDTLQWVPDLTVDLGGLPARAHYADTVSGAGFDGDLGTADDDLVALFDGVTTDAEGTLLVVPDAPCGAGAPTRGQVIATAPWFVFGPMTYELGWAPGVATHLFLDYNGWWP